MSLKSRRDWDFQAKKCGKAGSENPIVGPRETLLVTALYSITFALKWTTMP